MCVEGVVGGGVQSARLPTRSVEGVGSVGGVCRGRCGVCVRALGVEGVGCVWRRVLGRLEEWGVLWGVLWGVIWGVLGCGWEGKDCVKI